MPDRLGALLAALSGHPQLDRQAVVAVARQEGLGGGIGDNGTSFGPFQLHQGGALPANIPLSQAQDWAWSPAGLDYALSRIGKIAGGRRGADAVRAIVSQFERPADPNREIDRALAAYSGKLPPSGLPLPAAPADAAPASSGSGTGGSPLDPLLLSLFANNSATAGVPTSLPLLALALGGGSPSSPAAPAAAPTSTSAPGDPVAGDLSKWVRLAPNADRSGVAIQPATLNFVDQIAQAWGKPLTIGTGTNHNRYVVGSQRESDHWTGYAADIPATGDTLTHLGQTALIAAGADPDWAHKQTGGVFNIGGKQILFNTKVGGNHFNHLHVGIRTR